MFGPSGVFDPATYEPRSGKTFDGRNGREFAGGQEEQPTRSSATARPHDQPPVKFEQNSYPACLWAL
jgi:hypothetical protein